MRSPVLMSPAANAPVRLTVNVIPSITTALDVDGESVDEFQTCSNDFPSAEGFNVVIPCEGIKMLPSTTEEDGVVEMSGHPDPLQVELRNNYGIEVPVGSWNGRRFLRVSAHLYNSTDHIDRLIEALNRSENLR